MKKLTALILSSVTLSANAQIAASINSSPSEYDETTVVPYSVTFEGGRGELKRIECYAGRGCFTKQKKNPQGQSDNAFSHGRNGLANPPPNPNVTMWMAFTLKGRNVFSGQDILNHIAIFARASMLNMGLPNEQKIIDGSGLAIFKPAPDRPWNPVLDCSYSAVIGTIDVQYPCYSGIRTEMRTQTNPIINEAALRGIGYGALPPMLVTKKDGVAYNPYPYLVPAQYLLDNVDYDFVIHATPTVVAMPLI